MRMVRVGHSLGKGYSKAYGDIWVCQCLDELLHGIFLPCDLLVVTESLPLCLCLMRKPTLQGQLCEKDQEKLVSSRGHWRSRDRAGFDPDLGQCSHEEQKA